MGSPAAISEPVQGWITHYGESFNGGTLGCNGHGIYTSEDPTIVAVSPAQDPHLPCGTLLELCGPAGCLVAARKDSCPGCIDNGFDLSEAAIARVCGPGSDVCEATVKAVGSCGPADLALPQSTSETAPEAVRAEDALRRSMQPEMTRYEPQAKAVVTAPTEPQKPACEPGP